MKERNEFKFENSLNDEIKKVNDLLSMLLPKFIKERVINIKLIYLY